MKKAILIYIPVIHNGYLSLLDRHPGADIYLLSAQSIASIDAAIGDQLNRDIRAVPVLLIKSMLKDHYSHSNVKLFESTDQLKAYSEIVMPDEDISHLAQKQLPWAKVGFDTAFLRWDWTNSTVSKEVTGNFPVTADDEHRSIMTLARKQAQLSSDVWRQVGAAIKFASDTILFAAHNEHMPSPHSPYINGDARLQMRAGERPDIGTAIHAEQKLIAQAARYGKAIDGLSIYVTTFPCAVCARSIIAAGIKTVFFAEGYSTLDAAEVLIRAGIEIFQVK